MKKSIHTYSGLTYPCWFSGATITFINKVSQHHSDQKRLNTTVWLVVNYFLKVAFFLTVNDKEVHKQGLPSLDLSTDVYFINLT